MKKYLLTIIFLIMSTLKTYSYVEFAYDSMMVNLLNGMMSIDSINDFRFWERLSSLDGVYNVYAASGDGNVVGNGGGMSEGTFEYSFQILGGVLDDCLASIYCLDNDDEYKTIQLISEVYKQNINTSFYLIFVDGEKHPSFFHDEKVGGPRTAITGTKPMQPVFINSTHLYDAMGVSRWTVGRSIGLLVHELGHQTGSIDHRYLDKIGQKVKRFIEADKVVLENTIDEEIIRVWMRNSSSGDGKLDFGIFWGGEEKNLQEEIISEISCPKGFEIEEYSFSNLHWDHLRYDDQDGYTIPITMWMDLKCINHNRELIANYQDLEFKILLSRGKRHLGTPMKVKYFVEQL